jgi:hypothetical protein
MSVPMAFLAGCSHPAGLLPDDVRGYVPQGQDGLYTPENLFDLLNGGAEVYRSFNVRLVVNRRYGKPDSPDIMVDLFDMASSADAFGAYHHDMREGETADVGHESERMGSALFFWKDRFYVSILAMRETPETERAVLALGRAIAASIPDPGVKPEILNWLPREGLQPAQITYFHDWAYLNTRFYLGDENLLELDGETEGVLARYRNAANSSFLLMLIRYPSDGRAGTALARFLGGYLPGADPPGVARRPDGKWTAARSSGDLVVVVLDADNRPDIEQLVAGVNEARTRQEGSRDG